jgi:hypothetical protein
VKDKTPYWDARDAIVSCVTITPRTSMSSLRLRIDSEIIRFGCAAHQLDRAASLTAGLPGITGSGLLATRKAVAMRLVVAASTGAATTAKEHVMSTTYDPNPTTDTSTFCKGNTMKSFATAAISVGALASAALGLAGAANAASAGPADNGCAYEGDYACGPGENPYHLPKADWPYQCDFAGDPMCNLGPGQIPDVPAPNLSPW